MKLKLLACAGVLGLAGFAHAAPFQNGSFEFGPNPGSYLTLGSGNTSLAGWMVSSGSIDYIGNYWKAEDGNRSIDLNGNGPGAISQTFDTMAGMNYMVTFWLAGNPDAGGPALKVLTSTAGSQTGNFSFNATGNTRNNMGWAPESLAFKAAGSTTTLTFTSSTTGPRGPALDNVNVAFVPEPSAALLVLGGLGALLVRVRRRS